MTEENYHLLIDAIKDYAIYMLDVSGRISSWNAGAARLKGYTEEEIIGRHFSVLFLEEDRDRGKPARELEVARTKGRFEEESWRRRKDGSKFWALIVLTPLYSKTGEHIGFAKVTRDLTERRRSEELYLLLVNQVREYAIYMMDTTGQILTWNDGAERIKGYAAHEVIGRHFSVFYAPEDQQAGRPQKGLETAIRTGKFEEEGWRVKKDGSRMWANVLITPIYTDRHIGFAKITRDLTERKEMEKLNRANVILETTNKELERFAYTASHDLKEPLRKITMFSNFVLDDEQHPLAGKQRNYLEKILSSSMRLYTMIEDILNFSALSNKEHFELGNLSQIAAETVELLEQAITEKEATVHYHDLPNAIIIPSQMKRLFQNLVANAIKFSVAGVAPEIHIRHTYLKKEDVAVQGLWPADQYLQVTFSDNGIGFEPEHAERIFHLFDRLHSRASYEGSGLGLAICRKIAENHGGTITARSQPGAGAHFLLLIPA